MKPFRLPAVLLLALSLSSCATLKKMDQFLGKRANPKLPGSRQGDAPPLKSNEAATQAAPEPAKEDLAVKVEAPKPDMPKAPPAAGPLDLELRSHFGRMQGFTLGFDASKVVFIVNGNLVTAKDNEKEILVPGAGKLAVSVFNGGSASLQNAELGFWVDEGIYEELDTWEKRGSEVWYWCRAPIHPADPYGEPPSYFTTNSNFYLTLPGGAHRAHVRLKSLDKPEIVRKIILRVR